MITYNSRNNNNYRVIHPTDDSFNNNILNTASILKNNKLQNFLKRINRKTHKQKNKKQKLNGLL